MQVRLEVLGAVGFALAVTILTFTSIHPVCAPGYGYEYDCAFYDGFTWFIRAEVRAHYSIDPLLFAYAQHCGYRTAWGWPWTWYEGNLEVTIVGHGVPGRCDGYVLQYTFAGEGDVWIQGPGGIYPGCDTKSLSRFRSPTGQWTKDVLASVVAGPV